MPLLAGWTGLLLGSDVDADGDLDLIAQRTGLALLRNEGPIDFRLDGVWATSDLMVSLDVVTCSYFGFSTNFLLRNETR